MGAQRCVCLLLSGLLLVSCGGGNGDPAPAPDPQSRRTPVERLALKTFRSDCSDFLDYAADALTEQFLTPVYCATLVGAPCPVSAAEGPPPLAQPTPMPTPAATAAPGAPSFDGEGAGDPDRGSGTNTQEQGVDEADIVKSDAAGNLYILADNRLSIVDAYPPQDLADAAIATLDFAAIDDGAFYASELFLDDTADRAVVLGSSYRFDGVRSYGESLALIIDTADPQNPAVLERLGVDGFPLVARRIGERVHRVSRYDVMAPSWFYDDSELARLRDDYYDAQSRSDETAVARIRSEVRANVGNRVRAAGAETFLPRLHSGSGPGEVLACDAIAHPDVTTALGLMIVDSFDIDGSDGAASAVINNAFTVYASANNLYMVQSSWGWFFAPNQTEETAIYRLALPQNGAAAYEAIGKLDGSVNNSYQLSEFDGYLRVASTEFRFDEPSQRGVPYNHVTVLDAEAAGTMTKTGEIRDLAPGETIQGTRFIGPRGFVVTFEQVDPLFALDLSEPAAPRVADELKIPGFSSYLMPLGDDYLLTIGRDGTDEQLTGKVAVQLFDVADLSDIRQVAVLTPDSFDTSGSYSVAEYDPHAFTYFPDVADAPVPGTLSIPLQTYGERWEDSFNGFLVVRVDPATGTPLSELGRVDHSALVAAPSDCQPPPSDDGTPAPDGGSACEYWYGGQADPLRSVFLEDALGRTLYTISRAGVIASDAGQPSAVYASRVLP
ncbi:beta-propeller domain-containing protein [Sinimarinibacterium flocculans]|uniref:Beta propeller domain-containing protein n=1 Tax=Sinimarinibacterium flocculans TaxID=985250 RepID=A0A318E7Q2_9GAMM|nr:beta-propeller domain-containing protein [Sinimarinibacterium flocculans]PXV64974.1 beta propeller domain-containing protein [Sinimarinibacterium flocculans]